MEQINQSDAIYQWLAEGNSITSLEALRRFGCLRLSARIYEIRKFIDIKTEFVTRKGKTFAEYSLEKK